MTPTLKAVLFDMDDTVLDWSTRAVDWVEHTRQHLAYVFDYIVNEVHPLEERHVFYETVMHYSRQGWLESENGLKAPSYPEAIRSALLHVGVPDERIDLERCLEVYNFTLLDGVRAFPEAADVLSLLRANNVEVGLVTNASIPMRYRDRELEQADLLQYFGECRISAVDIGYIKPHPAIFEAALNQLGLHPGEAVFVGDNPEADVFGAQQVGMRAVLRVIENRAQPPIHIEPDGRIYTLHDLLPLLDAWYPGWRAEAIEDASGEGEGVGL